MFKKSKQLLKQIIALNVAEKPSVARLVSQILSKNKFQTVK